MSQSPALYPRVIPRLRQQWNRFIIVAALLITVAAIGLSLLGLVVVDAAIVLPAEVRASGGWGILAIVLVIAMVALRAATRASELRVARAIEQYDPSFGTVVTNAVQFAGVEGDTPVNRFLRQQAVALGRQRGESARLEPVVRRRMLSLVALAGATCLVWLLLLIFAHDVLAAVLPRLLDPNGDHPPYSPVKIAVSAEPTRVIYGGQCDIFATTSGGAVDRLMLIIDGAEGEAKTTMFRRPDRSWFQTMTNLRAPMTFWVTDGRARTRRQTIQIVYTPKIVHVEIICRYPAYTRLRDQKIELADRDLFVPLGTTLSVRVVSNRPLAYGTATITPLLGKEQQIIKLTTDDQQPTAVTGQFEIDRDLAIGLDVTDVDERRSSDQRRGRVRVKSDRRPVISVLEPGRDAIATPDVTIPVRVVAEDDYGVEQLIWFRSLNDSIETSALLAKSSATDPRRLQADTVFNLQDLGVRPGDVIEYFFEAVDNDPNGPNVATSRIFNLQIISREEYERMARMMMAQQALFDQYLQLNQALGRMAERAEVLQEKLSRMTHADRAAAQQAAAALAEQMRRYREQLGKAAQMPTLADIESHFLDQLAEQAAQMAELQAAADATAGGALDAGAASRIAKRLRDMAGQSQQQIGEPAQQIVQAVRLISAADQFVQLTKQQEQLAQFARRFQQRSGNMSRREQMEMQELLTAQARIRDELHDLLDELPGLVEALPDEPQYDALKKDVTEFLDAVEQADIINEMDTTIGRFAALDGPGAHAASAEAFRRMSQLITKCQTWSGKGQMCLRFQPTLREYMGRSLEQIMAALKSTGAGDGGKGGYSLFNRQVGLYGPTVQLTGVQSKAGLGASASAAGETTGGNVAGGSGNDPGLDVDVRPGRVRLQQEVAFPLEFRTLVGEYFRVIAESQE